MSTIDLDENGLYVNANNIQVQQFSNTLVGLSVSGSFDISTVDDIDFLEGEKGVIRNMVIKLLETDRGTGAFTQLKHEAHLEVECDFRKFIIHNPSSGTNNEDDSYQLTGITLTNKTDVSKNIDSTKIVHPSRFTFNIDSSLTEGIGAPLNADNLNNVDSQYKATYDTSVYTLTSNWFPSGAVIIDLKSHSTMADVSNNVKVTVTSDTSGNTYDDYASASDVDNAPSADDKYQISVSTGNIGMTLYSKLSIIKCNDEPTLSIESSFQPDNSAAIIGSAMNLDDHKVTVHLLETNVEDFTKAQIITLGVVDSSGNDAGESMGTLSNLNVILPNPTASTADDFSISIGLDELGGSLGNNMKSALTASISQINDDDAANAGNLLLKAFTISVHEIAFNSTGDFSGFMRTLYAGNTDVRDVSMPINVGEKLIISSPVNIGLAVQPFAYSGFNTEQSLTASAGKFNLIHNMSVYGVLKHKLDVVGNTLNTPIMTTADYELLS